MQYTTIKTEQYVNIWDISFPTQWIKIHKIIQCFYTEYIAVAKFLRLPLEIVT
jgi:hypothetical protein